MKPQLLNSLPKDTQLVSDRAGIQTQVYLPVKPLLFQHLPFRDGDSHFVTKPISGKEHLISGRPGGLVLWPVCDRDGHRIES